MLIVPRHLGSPGRSMAENRNSSTGIQTAHSTGNVIIPLVHCTRGLMYAKCAF